MKTMAKNVTASPANLVRHIRARYSATQRQFAEVCGVHYNTVSGIECGRNITPQIAQKLIKAAADRGLVVTLGDFVSWLRSPIPSPERPRPQQTTRGRSTTKKK